MRYRLSCGLLVSFFVSMGLPALSQTTVSNPAPIAIPEVGSAAPYPSTLTVSGFTGVVQKVTVTLNGLTHGWPDDLDVLLVGPTGQAALLMSDAGGDVGLENVSLTFDDDTSAALPDAGPIASGSYRPADHDPADAFPSPAPAGSWGTGLSDFSGLDLNGTWRLYVYDDQAKDGGSIASGWTLTVTRCAPGPGGTLSFTTQPANGAAGAPLTTQPVVTVVDTCEQVKTSYNGPVTVSLAGDSGAKGAVLTGATTLNAVNGVATFTNLSIDRGGLGYVLVASADGYTIARSAPFDARPLVFHVKPAAQGGSDLYDGLSWEAAKATVQAALDAAFPGDEVWVSEGTYLGRVNLRSGVALYGGFAGTEEGRDERDWNAHPTVLDAEKKTRVVSATDLAQEVVIDGFTVRNGSISTYGGGIYASNTDVVVTNNTITGNSAPGGGAIYCYKGNARIMDNTITDNGSGESGVVHIVPVSLPTVVFSRNKVYNNRSERWNVHVGLGGTATTLVQMEDNVIHDNSGGIRVAGSHNGNTAMIIRNRVYRNAGSGISADAVNGILESNTVFENGGRGLGGYTDLASEQLIIRGNIVTDNTNDSGTGGISASASPGTITVENNLVARNVGSNGAGMQGEASNGGTMRIVNNTIVENSPQTSGGGGGGGLFLDARQISEFLVANNVVAFNESTDPFPYLGGIYNFTGSVTYRNNNVFGNTPVNYGHVTDPTGTNGNISQDPLFVDRAGGDYRLLIGSPCIDAGGDVYVTAGGVDLEGKPRVIGAHVDIGAYEFLPGGAYTWAECLLALKAAGGLVGATSTDAARLNVVGSMPERVDVLDAARLARIVAGLG